MREFAIFVGEAIGVLLSLLAVFGLCISMLPSPTVRRLLRYLQARGILKTRL